MTTYETPQDWKGPKWWRNRELDERVFHMRIPPRYANTRGGSPWLSHVNHLQDFRLGDNFFVTGPAKSGKTRWAVSFMYGLLTSGKVSARFVDSDDYIEMIKDSFDSSGYLPEMYSNPHLIKLIKGVFDVVVLDGLGEERQTDFAVHEIGTLLRHRHDHNLTTIVTSTMSLTEAASHYRGRIGSFVESAKVVKCNGGQ